MLKAQWGHLLLSACLFAIILALTSDLKKLHNIHSAIQFGNSQGNEQCLENSRREAELLFYISGRTVL